MGAIIPVWHNHLEVNNGCSINWTHPFLYVSVPTMPSCITFNLPNLFKCKSPGLYKAAK